MGKIIITWKKSAIGYNKKQKAVIQALGLKRLHHTVEHYDTPSIRGMANKVAHLVHVVQVPNSED